MFNKKYIWRTHVHTAVVISFSVCADLCLISKIEGATPEVKVSFLLLMKIIVYGKPLK